MKTVWWIRHAESANNVGAITESPASAELTPKGFEQAKQLALCFECAPALIVTSSYIRTKQTAQPTLDQFPATPCHVWAVHEYIYLSPARYANTTIDQRRPMAAAFWEKGDPEGVEGVGAESFAMLIARAKAAMARVKATPEEFVAIFSHGMFMKAVIWTLLLNDPPISADAMKRYRSFHYGFDLPNAGIIEMQFHDTGKIFFTGVRTLGSSL